MKKQAIITGILLSAGLLILPGMSFARDGGAGRDGGRMKGACEGIEKCSTLTPEQRTQIEKLHQKFREDNAETLKQLTSKRFDMGTLLNADKPDLDKAKAIQKEISALKATLDQKRLELQFNVLKINPDAKLGRGMGMGRGMGRGMGECRGGDAT